MKIQGLKDFYGIEDPATLEFFSVHSRMGSLRQPLHLSELALDGVVGL